MDFHSRKPKLAFVVVLAIAFGLAACTRSASTPPPIADGTGTSTPSGLTSQQMTMEAVRSALLTQTAQAGGGEPTDRPEEPVGPTGTPLPPVADTPVATATTRVVATAPVGQVPSTYTLQDGEHPYCIARRFDIDPTILLAVNGLDSSTLSSPGMTLTIPQDADPFPGPRALRQHPASYTVQPGETIYAVACIFGDVYPIAIAQANGLTEPYDVSPGDVLQIP